MREHNGKQDEVNNYRRSFDSDYFDSHLYHTTQWVDTMSLKNILQIRDIFKEHEKTLTKTIANYMLNQISYNFVSVIKTSPLEVEEMLNAIDEMTEIYHRLDT